MFEEIENLIKEFERNPLSNFSLEELTNNRRNLAEEKLEESRNNLLKESGENLSKEKLSKINEIYEKKLKERYGEIDDEIIGYKAFFETKNFQKVNKNLRNLEQQINDKELEIEKINIEIKTYYNNLSANKENEKNINDIYKELDSKNAELVQLNKNKTRCEDLLKKMQSVRSKFKEQDFKDIDDYIEKQANKNEVIEPKEEVIKQQIDENPKALPAITKEQSIGTSFFEIVAKTDTVHIGNIEGKMHTMAHQPLFRTGIIESLKKGDPIGAITGIIPKTMSSVIMFGPKIISKAACLIRGTDKKVAELQDNINKLTPEEFDILTKDNGNSDYSLNPATMVQFKFNDKYLQAIKSRVDSDRNTEKMDYLGRIQRIQSEKDAITKAISNKSLTEDERKALAREANIRAKMIGELEKKVQKAETQRLAFEDGMELKSSRKKNIEGWIAAVRNPNNISNHKQMAHYSAEVRKARENGDVEREFEMSDAMRNYANSQVKTSFGHISRGSYQKAPITLSREQQTKGREILTSAAVVSSILATVRAVEINNAKVQNQQQLDATISKHNQDLTRHNKEIDAQNQSISSAQHAQQQVSTVDDNTVSGAVNYIKYNDAANIRAQKELTNLNNGGAATGSWENVNRFPDQSIDQSIHIAEAHKVQGVSPGAGTQTYINEINQSVDTMIDTLKQSRVAEQAYQNVTQGNFDVTRFMDSTAQAQIYSQAYKEFLAQSLTNNDALKALQQITFSPVSDASGISNFTINIPSALLPTAAALVANAINAHKLSDSNAKEVVNIITSKENSSNEKNTKENNKDNYSRE